MLHAILRGPSRVRFPMWFFLAALWVVSAFDYADHVSRPGEGFDEHWLGWLGFTFASTFAMSAELIAVNMLGPRRGWPRLLIDLAGAALAPAAHVWVIGPLANRVFYPVSDLHFTSPWGISLTFVIGLLGVSAACWATGWAVGLVKGPLKSQAKDQVTDQMKDLPHNRSGVSAGVSAGVSTGGPTG